EAVSEYLKRPLYSISIRELLRNITELEDRLSRIFQITSYWNAIFLLDEADIFLKSYSLNNLTRNGLVSIFLCKLEYYKGILFLTTNRVGQFNKAILSRIYLLLRYKGLTQVIRRQVWRNFLSRAATSSGDIDIKDEELEELTIPKLNGRQIKNIMSVAQAFARKERSKIEFLYTKKALEANEKFFTEFYRK
ncbi:uncharacterized protein K444DRAFT_503323, partial [Hyaloscypha bicolor E]